MLRDMKGMVIFGKELRLFKEWSKLIGFRSSVKLFGQWRNFFSVLFAIITFSALIYLCGIMMTGCTGLSFEDETKGELVLSFSKVIDTKAVARSFPDSNNFFLTIKSSNGTSIYSGTYGQRPEVFQLNEGSYDVKIFSRYFSVPEYDTPCFADAQTVLIQPGKTLFMSVSCRQTNAALRLQFSEGFKSRYSAFRPEIQDSLGTLLYTMTENRFAYVNPGVVKIMLRETLPAGSTELPEMIEIFNRRVSARDMLTVNFHSEPLEEGQENWSFRIDTTANWTYEYIVIGGDGDGLSKSTALKVSQIVSFIGTTDKWVTGYIVGGDLTSSAINFEAPFESATNLAIADSPTERDRSKCASVSLPIGTLRDLLNLKDNPLNLGKKVYLKGTIVESYFNLTGLNPLTSAEF